MLFFKYDVFLIYILVTRNIMKEPKSGSEEAIEISAGSKTNHVAENFENVEKEEDDDDNDEFQTISEVAEGTKTFTAPTFVETTTLRTVKRVRNFTTLQKIRPKTTYSYLQPVHQRLR